MLAPIDSAASATSPRFDEVPPDLLEGEVARILASRPFRQSPRHQRFLKHLVAHASSGNVAPLKESVLACEVFGRPADGFDPSQDTIVRVEARRLRQRLDRYYRTEGRDAPIEIHLQVGSYVPHLRWRLDEPGSDAETRRVRDLVERGEYFLRQPLARHSLEEARARFEAALADAPRCVPALVGLARAWFNLAAGWHHAPRFGAEQASEALRRALELDEDQSLAHALLGAVTFQYEYDWPSARRSFRRAIELAPRQAFAHSAYGSALLARGDLVEAEHEIKLARSLDPQYANARMHMVNLRIAQGRLGDAQAEVDALLDIAPRSLAALGGAGLLAMIRGESQAAIAFYERACVEAPDHPNAYASLAAAQGFAGDVAAADATIARTRERFGDDCLSPYVLAIVAARCGRADEAIALLARAVDVRDPSALLMPRDPSFTQLHTHPAWTQITRRLRREPRARDVALSTH
ncbi:MAG: tetratricopeptide repeat protein [Burkholderiales bacterium]